MRPAFRSRAPWLFAAALLLALLAFANRPLLTGRAAPRWDAVDLFEPSFALVGDAMRNGELLKWDPWAGGGAPDWTQPELGTTSPVMLAAAFLSSNPLRGYILYWLSVWAFGALGMLLLARHAGAPASGGVVVACGFAASGFFTGHAEHMSSLYSVSFLPWILWRFDRGLHHRDWWCGAQAGVLYGLSALGGYPEYTILTPGFLLLWALARGFAPDPIAAPSLRRRAAAALRLWIATVFGGALIFALPYAGLLLGTRGYTDYIGPRARDISISSNLLPAGALSTFFSPFLANYNLAPNALWPSTDISMTSIYTGAAVLLLAAFALRRKDRRWWIAAIAAFFLCCALGRQTPLRGWLYDLLPPTRYFRNPSLFRVYVLLVLGFLAALGARDVAHASPAARLRLWRLAIAASCCAAICFEIVSRISRKSLPDFRLGEAHLCAVWLGLAALAFLFQSGRLTPPGFLRLAAALACFDALGALALSHATLWDNPMPAWVETANAAHTFAMDLPSLQRDALAPAVFGPPISDRNLLSKTAVLDNYTTHQDLRNRFHLQIAADPLLSSMALSSGAGSSRIWFSSAPLWLPPSDAAFSLFLQRVHQLGGQPILLLHSPAEMLALRPQISAPAPTLQPLDTPPCLPATVTRLNYKPNLLSFQYDAPSPGYLLVTDRWADGWEATVNGQPRPVLGADFIYRALQLDAGPNSIQFLYNPPAFRPLLAISWGTLLLAALWQVRLLLRQTNADR